eukprot:5235064-Prymnesium_polylepis.1
MRRSPRLGAPSRRRLPSSAELVYVFRPARTVHQALGGDLSRIRRASARTRRELARTCANVRTRRESARTCRESANLSRALGRRDFVRP